MKAEGLSGGYGDSRLINNVSLTVEKGEFLGILGPNGSGKTTLLRLLTGTLPAKEGSVYLAGKPLADYKPKELARIMAVLPQKTDQAFTFTVKETVAFGRYPFQTGLFRQQTEKDEAIVQEAMEQTGVSAFAEKSIRDLSGGEQQRVYLAQALAQQPRILFLDEPTNFLDLAYQKELLDLIKRLTRENGLAAVSVFHDLNTASLYCDELLFMKNGTAGPKQKPEYAVSEHHIKAVYDTDITALVHHSSPKPMIVIQPEKDSVKQRPIPFETLLQAGSDDILLQTEIPLRTLSSAPIGAGFSWSRTLILKRLPVQEDPVQGLTASLLENGFHLTETCAMASPGRLDRFVYRTYKDGELSVFICVMTGFSIWILINGYAADQFFVKALMTAEAERVKVLGDGRLTEGDILIAATQAQQSQNTEQRLNHLIQKGTAECVKEAAELFE
ncbi:ATP-binding cassette domain-containing protein [Bacillus spizizenii]|uniref:ABC transporter ATP-binding protein n=1 Tax=Bacillus spizizenii TaxID=96241 RepID=UPI00165CA305|nr:ATP-binding cassette domain-containing protein [Bacillus spizizenii]MCY7832547.1 ATP-binding cassette domain-containing protein [Bacillus spizizenii]MCY8108913.1 ATP-binding cassette domain-containing protein [Bacillus spizizenii]MCY8303799.1 ATP-binding cassette domain-containing protein [Bacillus spizizenii]MCY8656979.1 ATP-binding cassette domain-containing protein [Bacillus spizizenii]MCY8687871.1 ATP-binding cassette domain-containing protein [Bacillus spizizenii]